VPALIVEHVVDPQVEEAVELPDWGDEDDGGWDSEVDEEHDMQRCFHLPSLGLNWAKNSDFERSKRGPYGTKGICDAFTLYNKYSIFIIYLVVYNGCLFITVIIL
jgi:hypothetical protein